MKKFILIQSMFFVSVFLMINSCETIKNTSNKNKGIAVGASSGAVLGGVIGNNVGNKNNTALGAKLNNGMIDNCCS